LVSFVSCESKDATLEKQLVGQWHMLNPEAPSLWVSLTYHADGTFVVTSKYEKVRLAGLMNTIKDRIVSGSFCVKNGHVMTTVNESSAQGWKKGETSRHQIRELSQNKLVLETQDGKTEKYDRAS
jgi:hypothetical protein